MMTNYAKRYVPKAKREVVASTKLFAFGQTDFTIARDIAVVSEAVDTVRMTLTTIKPNLEPTVVA